MEEIKNKIEEMLKNLAEWQDILNWPQREQKILELEEMINQSDFWQDQKKAKKISQELALLKQELAQFDLLRKELAELKLLAEESDASEDCSLNQEIEQRFLELEGVFKELEVKFLMSGIYDRNDALLAIHAGTGGVDAMDWAEMLERMYLRYSERKKFKVKIIDRQVGNEAGIKSVILEIGGLYAYGNLKSEAGVHRLVRISPYDAEKMRHTSFALVEVLPELESETEYQFKEEDLEIDTFRSSGHGGQSVNTTDSAVRIKHKPTGIVVSCQNERSQLQNKQTALKILAAKVKQYNEAKEEEERKKIRGEFSEAAWGNQARSYVLQPYQLVKDHRTDYETAAVGAVLDGGLEELVEAYLKKEIEK